MRIESYYFLWSPNTTGILQHRLIYYSNTVRSILCIYIFQRPECQIHVKLKIIVNWFLESGVWRWQRVNQKMSRTTKRVVSCANISKPYTLTYFLLVAIKTIYFVLNVTCPITIILLLWDCSQIVMTLIIQIFLMRYV